MNPPTPDPPISSPAPSTTVEASVTDIRLECRTGASSRWQITLDPPLNLEYGSNASSMTLEATAKSGASLRIPVIDLIEAEGVVWYVIEKPLVEGTVLRIHGDALRTFTSTPLL